MRRHYIGMAGLHGCMPAFVGVYATKGAAYAELAEIHELSASYVAKSGGCMELDLRRHGNEYMEVVPCDCGDPDHAAD